MPLTWLIILTVWTVGAIALGVLVGKSIALADRRQPSPPPDLPQAHVAGDVHELAIPLSLGERDRFQDITAAVTIRARRDPARWGR